MQELEKKIMQTCGELVKRLPARERERFLSFTEGMAYMNSRMAQDSAPEGRQK